MIPDLGQQLKNVLVNLPYMSTDLPGIGGVIKASPEHFQVEELLPYAPCGEGEHVFIRLRRSGWNTADVGQALGRLFGIRSAAIGWGGRKDKHAVTTQSFSISYPMVQPISEVESKLRELPFDILEVKRHRNKIKTGHVAANRFDILLSDVSHQTLAAADAIAQKIKRFGIPNFYGEQRFGFEMRNVDRAIALLRRGKARGKKEGFMVSALQSALFNLWLKERMDRGTANTVIKGDLVQKTDTGGMFVVEDLDEARLRFMDRKLVYTGPIFGYKMRPAHGDALGEETRLLTSLGLDLDAFKPLKAAGTRRRALLYVEDLSVERAENGLRFGFTLPSGAYATTVMREFTRPPVDTAG